MKIFVALFALIAYVSASGIGLGGIGYTGAGLAGISYNGIGGFGYGAGIATAPIAAVVPVAVAQPLINPAVLASLAGAYSGRAGFIDNGLIGNGYTGTGLVGGGLWKKK